MFTYVSNTVVSFLTFDNLGGGGGLRKAKIAGLANIEFRIRITSRKRKYRKTIKRNKIVVENLVTLSL